MAASYYSALIAAWQIGVLPSTVISGTPFSNSDTTNQKISKINSWLVTGPTRDISISITGQKLQSILAKIEAFAAGSDPTATPAELTAANNILAILGVLDGPQWSQHIDTLYTSIPEVYAFVINIGDVLVQNPNSGITQTYLNELEDAINGKPVTWWLANGYRGPITLADTIIAGLS
jgi:hypothetical protein